MKITEFKDLIPYIGRVVCWCFGEEKEYPYIDNITTYIKKVSEELSIDYDSLYNDLKSNLSYYYSDPHLGPMKSQRMFTHVINDSQVLWYTEVEWNEEDGSIIRKTLKKVVARLEMSLLYKMPFSGKIKGELKPVMDYWNDESDTVKIKDSIRFHSDADSLDYISQSYVIWKIPEQVAIFTTEEEAKTYIDSLKPKEIEVKKKKSSAYKNLLKEAEKLEPDQIRELIVELEGIYDKKIDKLNLDPLSIALTYKGSATEIDSCIIGEETATMDWINKNMDPRRYETIEYEDILDQILVEYDENIEWKGITEGDQEVIQEIADYLRKGCKGFKWDW